MDRNLINNIIKDDIKSIKKIKFGINNETYIINKRFVIRLKKYRDRFYSSKNEREVLHKTASLFLSEKVSYLDTDGNKVSDYIPNTHIYSGKDEEIIQVATMLKKLHSCKEPIHAKFKVAERYIYYKAHSGVKEKFGHEDIVIKRVRKIYHKYKKVICHNDVVDNNLLFTPNRCYLIDYEFAGKNIPLFDLASFISENNITDTHKIQLFLKTYDICEDEFNDLEIMMMFLNLLWFYWANERYLATKKEAFKKIAKIKREHIDNDMKALLIYPKIK